MSFFDAAFSVIVGEEGGYVNDPQDPGGETRWGISKRAYPNLDIKSLTLDEAKAIYRRDYWDAMGCDALSWEMALISFDCAVNQGVGISREIRSLTSNAIDFQAERALRYAKLTTFQRFGRGWMRRLFRVLKAAQRAPNGEST